MNNQRTIDDDDNNNDESPAVPSPLLLVLAVIFMCAYGRWKWTVAALTTIIVAIVLGAILSKWNKHYPNNKTKDITMDQIRKFYKKDMTTDDILQEIQELEQYVCGRTDLLGDDGDDALDDSMIMRTKVMAFLEALTERCCQEREEQNEKRKINRKQQQQVSDPISLIRLLDDEDTVVGSKPSQEEGDGGGDDLPPPPLEVCGYLAAHFALQLYPSSRHSHLEVAQTALALFAIVSQHDQVQQEILQHPQHLQVPIQVMQHALDYARDDLQDDDEQDERLVAETIQKGCLLLGALADNHADMAIAIVDHHGLQVILDAASWFRHHELVVQWSLWAVFQLCYEHERNQRVLVETGGLLVICTNLTTLPSQVQIVRHGLGILLDTLRLLSPHMPNLVRLALAAGLQDAVLVALQCHTNVLDIKMMGDELLRGTNYKGPAIQ